VANKQLAQITAELNQLKAQMKKGQEEVVEQTAPQDVSPRPSPRTASSISLDRFCRCDAAESSACTCRKVWNRERGTG
jgi:hypothetical protein